jgi:BirA family transcriptional regulator, biotin operon repressor / biotin---[acetyl-CoA-carboxylase] ligase
LTEPTAVPGDALQRLAAFGSVHLLDSVPSTNDYALSLAGRRERAIVIARTQAAGRGRFRRQWFSDPDSLTATFLVRQDEPGFPNPKYVTALAGLAAALAVEKVTGFKVLIRWPNDIVHKERKLAGLLSEGRRGAIAIGLGLNVNQQSFPADLPDAGSLLQATGRRWDSFELLEAFITGTDALLKQAGGGDVAPLMAEIKQRSAILQRRVEVSALLRRYVGTVIDLDTEGRIVLRTDSGRLVVLGVGQVRRLK